MIKDVTLRMYLIPLIGLVIPVISSLMNYRDHSWSNIITSNLLFLVFTFFIWQGAIAITSHIRNLPAARNILKRVFFISISAPAYAALLAGIFSFFWQKLYTGTYNNRSAISYTISVSGTTLFISLLYEILFLKKELDLDSKIVNQLDLERQYAEMNVLKNELDPHFIFNSLTTLSHLISNDAGKAQLFTNKLAHSYKYLLINKDRDMITLEEELRFIENYFFLLQIRHDHKLQLKIDINDLEEGRIMILPCALQILVENAIKHNTFTEEDPLLVHIFIHKAYLNVVNNIKLKPYMVDSTHIGIKNLRTRYKLTCYRDIIINQTKDKFIVKLPLIKPTSI